MSTIRDIAARKQKAIESIGRNVVHIKKQRVYRLESFYDQSGECLLIPLQAGGRATRKSYLTLWNDYQLVELAEPGDTVEQVRKPLWTVARFPNGSWATGGSPDDADYECCTVFQVEASDRDEAKRKGQAEYRKLQRRKAH